MVMSHYSTLIPQTWIAIFHNNLSVTPHFGIDCIFAISVLKSEIQALVSVFLTCCDIILIKIFLFCAHSFPGRLLMFIQSDEVLPLDEKYNDS